MAYNYCKLKPEENKSINTSEIKIIIKNLKTDNGLVITKPDKGNGCVIMNKQDYMTKMKVIIEDNSKFRRLGPVNKFDNTIKVENEMVKFLKYLVEVKEINQEILELIKPVGSIRPRMYGLPKVHKKEVLQSLFVW